MRFAIPQILELATQCGIGIGPRLLVRAANVVAKSNAVAGPHNHFGPRPEDLEHLKRLVSTTGQTGAVHGRPFARTVATELYTALALGYARVQGKTGADLRGATWAFERARATGLPKHTKVWTHLLEAHAKVRLGVAGGADLPGAWRTLQRMKDEGVPRNQ